jgi:ubiquinone/menaquinone biosynthesis C-methylase UbiE
MATTYIHGTEPAEQERLAALNRITNGAFLSFLDVEAGTRVLEVGSGLGLLAAEAASANDCVKVVGLERSGEQIAAAVRVPHVGYIRGDAHELPFREGAFHLVYARYLLEHVVAPEQVLREMRRVTRPGGRVGVCENDISLMRVDPPCPHFEEVWTLFQRLQEQLGGDGLIGRRLFRLFRSAGFTDIELSLQPEVHWQGSVAFGPWMTNLRGNLESARRGLEQSAACGRSKLDAAIAELDELARRPDASAYFMWNRAIARR